MSTADPLHLFQRARKDSSMPVPMVDIWSGSHGPDNEPIGWPRVRQYGVQAVMIKATQSTNYVNPWLERDAEGAHAAGIHVGYYHFAIPVVGGAVAQAEFFMSKIAGLPRDIGVSLDLEETNGLSWSDLSTFGANFLARVVQLGVDYASLYTNDNYMEHLINAPFGHYLWLAQTDAPNVAAYGSELFAWQHASGAEAIPGIPGVDGGLTDFDTLYLAV